MRKLCAVALSLLAIGVVSTPADAADAPTAKRLVQKLVAAKVCSDLQLVDPAETEVVCTPAGQDAPIRVTALRSKGASAASLGAYHDELCGVIEGGADRTVSYVVGRTWWATMDPTAVSKSRVARLLDGKVKTYRCV